MAENGADFTLIFRLLSNISGTNTEKDTAIRSQFANPYHFDDWALRWRERLLLDGLREADRIELMCASNPKFIARNHLVQEVIESAEVGDFAPLHTLAGILANPFQDQRVCARFSSPPRSEQVVHQTFCGT